MNVLQNVSIIGLGKSTVFAGNGGTPPYSFAVAPNGAGGTIDSDGVYTAPQIQSDDVRKQSDTIVVTDSLGEEATGVIGVATPLELFCDVIRREMGLADDQVYLWDQKINIPKDSRLYVAVGVLRVKPFSNVNRPSPNGSALDQEQWGNFLAMLDVNILSRGPAARNRKEEVVLALNSVYSQQQQSANSFYIATIPFGFVNLSEEDGAAIPYRFNISVNMQYAVRKVKAAPYFNSFQQPEIITDPEKEEGEET